MSRADRPNNLTRRRYYYALEGRPCATCGCPVDRRTVGKPDSLTFGHIVADSVGGRFIPSNIMAQCATCNDYLYKNGVEVMSPALMQYHEPYDLPSQAIADEWWAATHESDEREKARRKGICDSLMRER